MSWTPHLYCTDWAGLLAGIDLEEIVFNFDFNHRFAVVEACGQEKLSNNILFLSNFNLNLVEPLAILNRAISQILWL